MGVTIQAGLDAGMGVTLESLVVDALSSTRRFAVTGRGDMGAVLGLEAQRRGYAVWHYTPADLVFRDRKVMARAQPMTLRREKGNHFTLGESQMVDLSTLDVILLRQDPPFDMSYITTTHLLEHVHPKTLVVNDPASVRKIGRAHV